MEEQQINPVEFIEFVTGSDNLAAEISEAQLGDISSQVMADYEIDKDSMEDWFRRMERGLKLAQLVKEDKTYPFKGAANIKYPLITSAALQFNARAYPAIVSPDKTVKARVWGADPGGQKAARADRVSEHMTWQLSAQIPEWEEETDKLLVQLPIVGEMFRKWWYDPVEGRPRCRLIEPGKLIINDKVKNLDEAPRATEEICLYPSEIETRIRSGVFVQFEFESADEDEQAPQDFIEQHTRLDLDEDGYPEPYIVTVHKDSLTVVRIVADFLPDDVAYEMVEQIVEVPVLGQDAFGQPVEYLTPQPQQVPAGILSIKRGSYFVDFKFLPGLDGGFHGTGLGLLLGDISESINSIINMLLDAGHYASLGGGFIGSDFRMKGGAQRFQPGEWKKAATQGGDIKNAIVPLTFPGPDATLFQMLGMLIDAGRELSSVKDVMTGEQPRQNQTATTTLALIEQGMMVFTAAYKRIFRSSKKEYGLLARINSATVSPEEYNRFQDAPQPVDPKTDYDLSDMDIQPIADPNGVTKMQQAAKAQFVMQLAEQGLVDRGEALNRIAQAMDIPDVEALMPKPDPMQAMMADMQAKAMQADLAGKMADIELTLAKVQQAKVAAMKDLADAKTDQAKVALQAQEARFDGLLRMLGEDRERLETAYRVAGRMAAESRDRAAARGDATADRVPEEGNAGGMVSGAGGPGLGPAGPGLAGGMGGGLL